MVVYPTSIWIFLDEISRNALSHVCCVLLHIVCWAKKKIQFDRRFGKMMLLLVALSIEMFWEAKKKIKGFEEIMVLKFQRNKLRVSPFSFWLGVGTG